MPRRHPPRARRLLIVPVEALGPGARWRSRGSRRHRARDRRAVLGGDAGAGRRGPRPLEQTRFDPPRPGPPAARPSSSSGASPRRRGRLCSAPGARRRDRRAAAIPGEPDRLAPPRHLQHGGEGRSIAVERGRAALVLVAAPLLGADAFGRYAFAASLSDPRVRNRPRPHDSRRARSRRSGASPQVLGTACAAALGGGGGPARARRVGARRRTRRSALGDPRARRQRSRAPSSIMPGRCFAPTNGWATRRRSTPWSRCWRRSRWARSP